MSLPELPLPFEKIATGQSIYNDETIAAYSADQMHAYAEAARASIAAQLVELTAEVEIWKRNAGLEAKHRDQVEDNYDRLEEKMTAQLVEAQKDALRLDWLEGELEREQEAIRNPDRPLSTIRSLFRSNLPITRTAIDDAMRKSEAA